VVATAVVVVVSLPVTMDTARVNVVAESHVCEDADTDSHYELRESVHAALVVLDLSLMLLDVLKELNRVGGRLKVLLIHDLLHVLTL